MKKCLTVWSALVLFGGATACTKSSPARPSEVGSAQQTSSITDAKTGITLTSPQLVSPAPDQRFKFADQPLTLTIKNAATTGSTVPTYTFQVAIDPGFANIAYVKDGVPEGPNGQTGLKIDKLAGNKDYYWRAGAVIAGLAGPFSNGRAFNVGPEIIIQAPVLSSPASNGTLSGTGVLTTNNAARTGPAGQIFYRFEVSDSSSFGNLVFLNTVPEQPGAQTSVQMSAQLTPNATYFWRVQAGDPANGITGPYSSAFSFNYVPFDMRQAIIVDSPPDLGSWNETARITRVDFTVDAFLVDFDRRTGPDRWRDLDFGDGRGGTLQYTLGMCENINTQWYCSAVVQFWFGRELSASTPPSYVGRNWFYDARWGPLLGRQPANGDQVGLFVGTGNLRSRSFTGASCPQVCERSNVAMVTWHNDDAASFTFGIGPRIALNRR